MLSEGTVDGLSPLLVSPTTTRSLFVHRRSLSHKHEIGRNSLRASTTPRPSPCSRLRPERHRTIVDDARFSGNRGVATRSGSRDNALPYVPASVLLAEQMVPGLVDPSCEVSGPALIRMEPLHQPAMGLVDHV